MDKNLRSTVCSLYFWHTCDFGTKSRALNLLWKCKLLNKVIIMQNLKHRTLTESKKKVTYKRFFCKQGNTSITSLEHGWKSKTVVYNRKKFQPNWKSKIKFSVKSVWHCRDLKKHWKWYEWAKLNEYYHHAMFDSYHIYSVWKNWSFCHIQTLSWPASLTLIITQANTFHAS